MFSLVAIVSLALGIGANSAIFSMVNAVMLRSLPIRDPNRLVKISTVSKDGTERLLSLPMIEELQRRQQVFSSLSGRSEGSMRNFEAGGAVYVARLDVVTGEYYSTLGVRPELGRLITPDDASGNVAVLDYRCWERRFHKDPAVIGKSIRVETKTRVIIGVTPESFTGFNIDAASDVTIPIPQRTALEPMQRQYFSIDAIARLKEGVSIEQARAQLETVWRDVQTATVPLDWQGTLRSEFLARRIRLESAATGESFLRERLSRPLVVLMGATAMVLLLACVNLATLMLARAATRQRETAVRRALGATIWRLVCHHVVQSLLLALSGGALALVFADWTTRLLANLVWFGYIPMTLDVAPDLRVVAFTGGVALLAAILFSLIPIWKVARQQPAITLQRNEGIGGNPGLLGRLLVSTQVALSLILLIGAILLARTLSNLRSFDMGFRRDGILMAQLFARPVGQQNVNWASHYRELAEIVGSLGGVAAVSYSGPGLITMYEYGEPVAPKDRSAEPLDAQPEWVAPRFFEAFGIHLLQGRDLNWQDDVKKPRVAVVCESLAKRLFPTGDAIGQHIRMGADPAHQDLEIVGVVTNASLWNLRTHEPLVVYLPLTQVAYRIDPQLVVAVRGDPAARMQSVKRIVESMGYEHALQIETLRQRADRMMIQERLLAILSSFFGALALLLACIGLYGLMAYSVSSRTAEIGIRMALGAKPGTILRRVWREVLMLVGIGIIIGLPIAAVGSRWIAAMLFGVSAEDPASFAISSAALLAVGMLAGYVPARRASRVDPMSALRNE